uniref:BTB domain-containing protein n=1 Tax=Capitella teleta TaxID=283909 RepID=X2BA01_CAPTE
MKAFMASLHKFQEKEVMTDVTLILPDQSAIPCHKVVLMAASPFFETMFQSGLKEGAEQNIKLDFADSDIIKALVEFFYSGNIELTAGNIKEIVAGSEFLCCKHLKAHCEEYLVDTVGLSNCIDYYRCGQVFNLKLLIKTAFDFILFKFREFREISDFDKLTEDELVEVVSCDRLNAENEDVVFEAVVHWVNADPDAREEVFPRIAPLIRFPFCSQKALTDKICRNPLLQKPGCI